jgi:hypothetical protein
MPAILTAAVLGLGLAAHAVNVRLDVKSEEERADGDIGPLPDGTMLRVFSLGYDRLLADLFWIRTVYYMGDEHADAAGYPAAERLSMFVTDIDPKFQTVYAVMGAGLEGLARDPAAARRLLMKGIEHLSYWKLHFLLGFNYFFHEEDYVRAAEQMQRASELPGAAHYLPLLTARLYAAGGSPETAMLFVRARLEQATTETEREILGKRYGDLWIARDLARIDAAIERYVGTNGRPPATVRALAQAGFLDEEPRDPARRSYWIVDGRAKCDCDFDPLVVQQGYKPRRRPKQESAP